MEPLSILALESTPQIGPKTIEKVISLSPLFEPSNPSDIVEILKKSREKFGKIHVPDMQAATLSWNKAHEIIMQSKKHNIQLITRADAKYPKLLSRIANPPILLHVQGNIDALNGDCIAIVGTRKPSKFGIIKARELGAFFAEKGYVIVSGLADGIDTAAHQGALDVNGITIAVLAHGLDKIYPSKNKKLAEEIIGRNGALISEYPWGRKIFKNYFVARDRIQSGLSLGVIVVETGVSGGTLNTVKSCKDQNRTLIVLKHPREFRRDLELVGNDQLISKNMADFIIEDERDIHLIIKKLNNVKNLTSNSQPKPDASSVASFQTVLI